MRQLSNSEWAQFSQVDRERVAFWFQRACLEVKFRLDRLLIGNEITTSIALSAKKMMKELVLERLEVEGTSIGLTSGTAPPWSLTVDVDDIRGILGIWTSTPIHAHHCDSCEYVASYYTGELDDATPGDMNVNTVVDSYVCERFDGFDNRSAHLVSNQGKQDRPMGLIRSMIARRDIVRIEGVDLFWAETFLRYQRAQSIKQGN